MRICRENEVFVNLPLGFGQIWLFLGVLRSIKATIYDKFGIKTFVLLSSNH